MDGGEINTIYIPGSQFVITGHKIKVAGDDPSVGVYFVPVDDPAKAVKATPLAKNSAGELIGIAPTTGIANNRIEIRTQYSGSTSNPLKNPRIIISQFTLEES